MIGESSNKKRIKKGIDSGQSLCYYIRIDKN
ncbi:hypothetical protein [Salmonella phage SD-2_S15]|nr:hypothetical protein [Salmonella phage SD-2_S15]